MTEGGERPMATMTERRKEQTRREVALEAVRLFAAQGVAGTSGEEIARNVGVSVRTLWRYFPTKESFVQPLLATGVNRFTAWLRDWPHDVPLMSHLEDRMAADRFDGPDARALTTLIRLTREEPLLRAVWLQAHHDAEPMFAEVLAARAGLAPESLEARLQAAALNAALRVAAEDRAWHDSATDGIGLGASSDALLALSRMLTG